MEDLQNYIINIRRNYNRIQQETVWEKLILGYGQSNKDDDALAFLISSLYLRGSRKIESPSPGTILFYFPVNKENPSASVSRLLLILQEDLLGFAELQLKLVPAAFFQAEQGKLSDMEWEKKFNKVYQEILNRVGKVFIHQLPAG